MARQTASAPKQRWGLKVVTDELTMRRDGQPLTESQRTTRAKLADVGFLVFAARLYWPDDCVFMARRTEQMWDCFILRPDEAEALGRRETLPE